MRQGPALEPRSRGRGGESGAEEEGCSGLDAEPSTSTAVYVSERKSPPRQRNT